MEKNLIDRYSQKTVYAQKKIGNVMQDIQEKIMGLVNQLTANHKTLVLQKIVKGHILYLKDIMDTNARNPF